MLHATLNSILSSSYWYIIQCEFSARTIFSLYTRTQEIKYKSEALPDLATIIQCSCKVNLWRHVMTNDETVVISQRDCWRLSWADAKRHQEDGWLSGAPNSALSPRDGDGQPGLSVPDGGTLALALTASDESRALPEATLFASLWYAGKPLSLINHPFLLSLCAIMCILINRHRVTLS